MRQIHIVVFPSRCTYGRQANAIITAQNGSITTTTDGATARQNPSHMQSRRTRSQRTVVKGGAQVKVIDPIWGMDAEGRAVQMQHQDIALMTYEQLRKELSTSDRLNTMPICNYCCAQIIAATIIHSCNDILHCTLICNDIGSYRIWTVVF